MGILSRICALFLIIRLWSSAWFGGGCDCLGGEGITTRRVLMGPPLMDKTSFKVDPVTTPQSARVRSSCSSTPETSRQTSLYQKLLYRRLLNKSHLCTRVVGALVVARPGSVPVNQSEDCGFYSCRVLDFFRLAPFFPFRTFFIIM